MVTCGRKDLSCHLMRQQKPPITHSTSNPSSHTHFVTSVHKSVNILTATRTHNRTASFIIRFRAATSISSAPGAPTWTVPPVGETSPSPFQDLPVSPRPRSSLPPVHPVIFSSLFFFFFLSPLRAQGGGENRSASLSTSKVEMSRGATRDVRTYAHTLNLDLKRPFRPYCSATLNTNCSV